MADAEDKLAALETTVEEVDGLGPMTPEQQQAQAAEVAALDQAQQWGMIAFSIGGALSMLAPELRQVYTQEACMAWGTAMVPVAEKYGWAGPGNCPELGLLMATAGLAIPSVLAVRQRMAQLKRVRADAEAAKKAQEKPQEVQADGG